MSSGKSMLVFGSVLGSGPVSFVVSLLIFVAKRKFGWGICGSSGSFCFSVVVFFVDLPNNVKETTVFHAEFLIRLICLYQCQDRALERHRPCQRKKQLAAICKVHASVRR